MEKKGVEDINEDDVNKAQDNLGERSKILFQHNLAVFAVCRAECGDDPSYRLLTLHQQQRGQ